MNDRQKMRVLFEQKKELVQLTKSVGAQLDSLIFKKWGFSYSQTDDDLIIDSLDYGISDISFDDFVGRMNDYKKAYKKGYRKMQE
jgi:hypothetical protein